MCELVFHEVKVTGTFLVLLLFMVFNKVYNGIQHVIYWSVEAKDLSNSDVF